MTQQVELLKEIDVLPPKYFGEVLDFIGYLRYKEQLETAPVKRSRMTAEEETEYFNQNAEWLNREAMDVLSYQVDIWSADRPASAEVLES